MKIGTFSEALSSLKIEFRQTFTIRRNLIALWCQLASIIGFICSALVIRASVTYLVNHATAHPPEPLLDKAPLFLKIAALSFPIGLPLLALILGMYGILPGTRRKERT